MVTVLRIMWKGLNQILLNYGFIILVYALFWGVVAFTTDMLNVFLTALETNSLCEGSLSDLLAENIAKWRETDTETTEELGTDFCSLTFASMIKYLLGPSIMIVILLGFLTKRKSMYTNIFGGRPGLPITVNLLDECKNRMAYVAAFGATTNSVIDLFKGEYYFKIDSTETWINVFVGMINVAGVGVVFYPIFACIATKARVVGSFIGFFYTTTWVVFWVAQQTCTKTYTHPSQGVVYYMTFTPIFIFLFILLVRFFLMMIKSIRLSASPTQLMDRHKQMEMNFYQAKYVMQLLKPGEQITEDLVADKSLELKRGGVFARIWNWAYHKFTKYVYKPIPGFQYSLRALCTFSVAWQAVYVFACQYFYIGQNALVQYNEFVDAIDPLLNVTNQTGIDFKRTLNSLASCINVSFYISAIVAFLMMTMFILRMMASYRAHFMRLCRGDTSFLPARRSAPTSLMVSCLRYSGYQIGYILWGFVILLIMTFMTSVIAAYQVIIPIASGTKSKFGEELGLLWPSIVFALFLYMVQFVLSKYLFLQNNGQSLALTNRRFFHIMSYFFFFFNVILGLISCLIRAIKGMIFGTLFLSRIDKSTLMREYEMLDRGKY
uniref:Stimulated by retinoic acid gene 6 protein homolog n=1 Tax=Saccoglossus kowalevskii TaxID=10224 RepID=A0ABM0M3L2_SACKO|nr:PREDICTED: stimulated by retinoic acid gene 6 protein homolog [Saccoglossus kowalevskii]